MSDENQTDLRRVIQQQELISFAWRRALTAGTARLRERWAACARDLEVRLADFISSRRDLHASDAPASTARESSIKYVCEPQFDDVTS